MAVPANLVCVRCGAPYSLQLYASDCSSCRMEGAPSNLTVAYAGKPGARLGRDELSGRTPSLWRYDDFLPVSAGEAVTLGEGMTPLHRADRLGLGPLFIKDESQNPTWSFKDRLASVVVSMARRLGAKVIASSSSGNAGAAVAAYAAKAGLPCIVFTFQGAAGPMVTQMRAYGAMVLTVEQKEDRWKLLTAGVREFGWFPTSPYFGPAVGSNPYGIEGYKTLSYEVAEQLDWQVPDWCVLPVCYGDALYGMWKGFEEMRALGWIDRVPRLAAAEVSGSLGAALAAGEAMPPDLPRNEPTIAPSIGASRGTVQALLALHRTKGAAVTVENDAMLEWQARLAKAEGLYAEPASVAPLPLIERLRANGTIAKDASVVAVMTAGGLKDPDATERMLAPTPVVGGSVESAIAALSQNYGFRA